MQEGITLKKLMSILLSSFVLILAACGSDEPEVKETSKEKVEETKPTEPKLEISETKVSFTDFTIEIEKAEVKDNKLILKTRFTNDSYTEPTAFLGAAGLDVKQGEELLEEDSGVMSDPKSNYYYKNKTGINAPVEFEYELVNETDDIEVTFVPTDWDQESETITITLK